MATPLKSNGFIDLGKTYDGPSCCSPCCDSNDGEPPKPSYPSLYICTDKKIDLGEIGECLVKYARRQVGERTKDDGSTEYTYELDVQGIKPTVSTDAPAATDEGDAGEMDMSGEMPSSKGFKNAMMTSMAKGAKAKY